MLFQMLKSTSPDSMKAVKIRYNKDGLLLSEILYNLLTDKEYTHSIKNIKEVSLQISEYIKKEIYYLEYGQAIIVLADRLFVDDLHQSSFNFASLNPLGSILSVSIYRGIPDKNNNKPSLKYLLGIPHFQKMPKQVLVSTVDGLYYFAVEAFSRFSNLSKVSHRNISQGKANTFQEVCSYLESIGYTYMEDKSIEEGRTFYRLSE